MLQRSELGVWCHGSWGFTLLANLMGPNFVVNRGPKATEKLEANEGLIEAAKNASAQTQTLVPSRLEPEWAQRGGGKEEGPDRWGSGWVTH